MKGWLTGLGALLLLGCGARSALDTRADAGTPAILDAGGPTRRDAGRPDGGRPDAGGRDAGVPVEGCLLTPVVGTTTVFSEHDGVFVSPQAQIRADGGYDLTAVFVPTTRDRPPQPYAERFDATLGSLGPIDVPLRPAGPMITTTNGTTLGLCYRDAGDGTLTVAQHLLAGGGLVGPLDGTDGDCLAVAVNGVQWLVARRTDSGRAWIDLWEEPPGGPLLPTSPPRPLPPAPDTRIEVMAHADGFAWVTTGGPVREASVQILDPSAERVIAIADVIPTPGGPAIAPWAFSREGLAVAAWAGGLRVIVVEPTVEREVLRSEPLAFAMFGSVRPALAPVDGAMIVGALGYGDLDPFGGELSVVAIGAAGEELSRLDFPTYRGGEHPDGIDLAGDGNRAVVHWSEVIDAASGERIPVTRVMVLECVRP